jgi:serine-type D-Ala-D-Ala carboxypeptidase (penicillin-binding protein 5/6)
MAGRVMAVVVLWLLATLTTGFGPPVLVESDSAHVAVAPETLRLMMLDEPPPSLSMAAVVMDAGSGAIVHAENPHTRRAPASTTKMLTALVALRHADLDEVVVAGRGVLVEPSIIGLEPGDELTVEQLLYGLLLNSGNDAALALAEHIGGSVEGFAAMMNAEAKKLGMANSHFVNPHGLDAEDHYSTAYDLALLARTALRHPLFARIVSTREYQISGPVRWTFRSTNRLLASYPGADGIKTGYTDDAGRCLAFSATRDGRRAISVVLGSSDQWSQSRALLDYFFATYSWATLHVPDMPLSDYSGDLGPGEYEVSGEDEIPLPRWQRPFVRWHLSASDGPYVDDGVAGVIRYTVMGEEVARRLLLASGG